MNTFNLAVNTVWKCAMTASEISPQYNLERNLHLMLQDFSMWQQSNTAVEC